MSEPKVHLICKGGDWVSFVNTDGKSYFFFNLVGLQQHWTYAFLKAWEEFLHKTQAVSGAIAGPSLWSLFQFLL